MYMCMCVYAYLFVIIFQLHVYFHHPRVNRWTRNSLCRLIQIADVRSFHPYVLYDVLWEAAVVFLIVCDKNAKHTHIHRGRGCLRATRNVFFFCFCSLYDALNDHRATYCCPQPRNTFTTVFKIIRKLVFFLLNSSLTLFSFSALTLFVGRQQGNPACK